MVHLSHREDDGKTLMCFWSRSKLSGNYTAIVGLHVVSAIHPIWHASGRGWLRSRERLHENQTDAIVANHPGCKAAVIEILIYWPRVTGTMSAAQKIGKTKSTGEVEDVC